MEQFGNEVEKMYIVVKTHNSIFSPFYLVIFKVFSIFAAQSLKINSYEKSTLCYSGIVY